MAKNTGPRSGAAIPSPPEADPQIPAITVVPTAAPAIGGPGILVMALTMKSKPTADFTTEPNATTAQVLHIATTVVLHASPTCPTILVLS